VEVWRDYNGRATVEQRIEEMKNDLHADGFCTKAFFATEAAFLGVVLSYNLLSALPSGGDPAERIPQALDDAGGGVRGRSDLGAERAGSGGEVFR